jgi:hypothetical protein
VRAGRPAEGAMVGMKSNDIEPADQTYVLLLFHEYPPLGKIQTLWQQKSVFIVGIRRLAEKLPLSRRVPLSS